MQIRNLLAAAAAVLITASCGFMGIGNPDMDNGEAVEKVKQLVRDNVDKDKWTVVRLSWSEGIAQSDKLSNTLHRVDVVLMDKEGKLWEKVFGDADLKPEEEKPMNERLIPSDFDPAKVLPVDVEAIDTAVYNRHMAEAKATIPEEYSFRSVGTYTVDGMMPGCTRERFDMNVTEKGNSTELKGRRITTTYYTAEFVIEDGKAVMKD